MQPQLFTNPAATPSSSLEILIIKLSSLGDVIQTIPVVADILLYYPNAKIDWVVEEAFAPLLLQVQGIRRVIPIAQRRWNRLGLKQLFDAKTRGEKKAFFAKLCGTQYDVVLDLQGLIKSGLITRRTSLKSPTQSHIKKPFRATFGNRSESCGYEWPVRLCTDVHVPMPARIHAIQRTRLLCARALGYDEAVLNTVPQYPFKLTVYQPSLASNEASFKNPVEHNALILALNDAMNQTPYVVLVHGSSRADNVWPLSHWQALAVKLTQQCYTVILPHSNTDELHNAQLIAQSNHGVHVLERCDLLNVAQLIAHSSGVIGLDTGLSHIAVALDKPCVHIFLHDRAWRAGPLTGDLAKPYQSSVGSHIHPKTDEVLAQWIICKKNEPTV